MTLEQARTAGAQAIPSSRPPRRAHPVPLQRGHLDLVGLLAVRDPAGRTTARPVPARPFGRGEPPFPRGDSLAPIGAPIMNSTARFLPRSAPRCRRICAGRRRFDLTTATIQTVPEMLTGTHKRPRLPAALGRPSTKTGSPIPSRVLRRCRSGAARPNNGPRPSHRNSQPTGLAIHAGHGPEHQPGMAPSCCIRARPSNCVQMSVTRPSSRR